jgi:hypothetical protein
VLLNAFKYILQKYNLGRFPIFAESGRRLSG